MLKGTYPVRWMGRQAVVALPEHINGLDRLIPVYPCVEAATAAGTPAVPVTLKAGGPHAPQPETGQGSHKGET